MVFLGGGEESRCGVSVEGIGESQAIHRPPSVGGLCWGRSGRSLIARFGRINFPSICQLVVVVF